MVARGPPDRGGWSMAALCEILQHKGEHSFNVQWTPGHASAAEVASGPITRPHHEGNSMAGAIAGGSGGWWGTRALNY
eukprot:14517162-Alexandrium_andersonii.AAC.1